MCGVSKQPSVEKLWREKANMQIRREPFSRTFGTNETQELLEGQLVHQELLNTAEILGRLHKAK